MKKSRLKILQVVPYFYPSWAYGGPVSIVYWICRNLIKLGHRVTVYTTDAYDDRKRLISPKLPVNIDGIKTFYFPNLSNFLAYYYRLFFPKKLIIQAQKEINNFDIIHLHDFYTFQNIIISNLAIKNNIPYIISPHGALDPIRRKQRKLFKEAYLYFFGKKMLEGAAKIVVTAQAEIKQCLFRGVKKQKIEVIPNGVNLDDFKNLDKKEKIRQKFNLSKTDKVIVYLGQIHYIKGLDLLVNAFFFLVKKNPQIRLLIIGSDSGYLSTLKTIIKNKRIDENKVTFTGLLKGKEKLSLLAASDIFVYPSYSEGFSISILEAMACSLPIIITDKCYFPEVGSKRAGLIIHPDNRSLRQALELLLTNQKLTEALGQSAKNLIKEKYQWSKVVGQLEKVYFKVFNIW